MQPAVPSPTQRRRELTAREAMRLGVERLRAAGVEGARLDMSLIMAEALGTDRLGLYMDLDRPLNERERGAARGMLARRIAREPMAYILGRREFFGLNFKVTRETLIPRPETEHLVETALTWLKEREELLPEPRFVDIGTGSGAIAVALAQACARAAGVATDITAGALAVARENAAAHGVEGRIEFSEGALFEALMEVEGAAGTGTAGGEAGEDGFDLILSNPPYIAEGDKAGLAPEVAGYEPHAALFSGTDGLECIRGLVAGAAEWLRAAGLLALECGAGQAQGVCALIAATGAFEPAWIVKDLAGIGRVVAAQRRG